jgi:hypothetical protein
VYERRVLAIFPTRRDAPTLASGQDDAAANPADNVARLR